MELKNHINNNNKRKNLQDKNTLKDKVFNQVGQHRFIFLIFIRNNLILTIFIFLFFDRIKIHEIQLLNELKLDNSKIKIEEYLKKGKLK